MEATGMKRRVFKADYRVLFDHTPVAMMIVNPENGAIVDVNRAAQKFYGYTRDDMCRMSIGQINVLGSDAARDRMRQAMKRRINQFDFTHRMASGELKQVRVISGPVRLEEQVYLYSIIEDVSEEKRREWMQLAEFSIPYICLHSRNLYEMMDSIINFLIENTDVIGCRFYAEFEGHSLEPYDRTFVKPTYHWFDLVEEQSFRNRVLMSEMLPYHVESKSVQMMCGDGAPESAVIFHVNMNELPVRSVFRLLVDQTKADAVQKCIHESAGLFNVVVGGVRRIIQQDESRHAIVRYRRALAMAGVQRWDCPMGNALGRIDDKALLALCAQITRSGGEEWDENARTLADRIRQAERRGAPYFQMEQFLDGQWVLHNGCVEPPTEQDPDWHLVGVTMPIGELKELQLQLEAKVYELEELTRAKDRFLSGVSHELKTPLNGIWGMTQLLEASTLTAEQRDYVNTLKYSNHRLMRVIENLLCHTGLESAQRNEHPWEPVVLADAFGQVMEGQQLMNPTQNPWLELSLNDELNQAVEIDSVSLRIILDQLLDFGFQKSSDNRVRVEGGLERQGGQQGIRLDFTVKWDGCPQTEGLFSISGKSVCPEVTSEDLQGPVLGLEIIRRVIRRTGMSLSAERSNEEEMRWRLYVPIRSPAFSEEPPPCRAQSGMKALVVDDDETSRLMMGILCRKAGVACDSVNSGYEALELYRTNEYGVVLMDIQMPGMTGEELLLALNQLDAEQEKRSSKVAVTAYSLSGNRERYLGMGFDQCLAKPLDYHEFCLTVQSLGLTP